MSTETIKPDDFSKKIKGILTEANADTVTALNEISLDEAKTLLKEIKSSSQSNFGKGSYAKGWARKRKKKSDGHFSYTIYNKTDYRLTHLLEHGHVKWLWGKGPYGTVSGRPHIRPCAEKSAVRYYEKIKTRLSK